MRKKLIAGILAIAIMSGCILTAIGYKQFKTVDNIDEEEISSSTVHVDYNLSGYSSDGQSNLLQHYLESDAGEHVIARMYIPDTAMETPIVDSEYYFRRDLSGKYSTNGTPLVLTTEHFMKPNHNAVIYGHRLYTGDDFGMLKSYLEQDFYDAHPNIYLETTAGETTWKIISVFTINVATDSFVYSDCENLEKEAERNYFLSEIKQRNQIDTGSYTYQNGDQFITLSTCHYETNRENGRLVVVAVRQ